MSEDIKCPYCNEVIVECVAQTEGEVKFCNTGCIREYRKNGGKPKGFVTE